MVEKESKQHLTAYEIDGEAGRIEALNRWRVASQTLSFKRNGIDDGRKVVLTRKRRRVKSLTKAMKTNNMLRVSAGCTFQKFKIEYNFETREPSPFTWPHCNFSSDVGPDMLCVDNYYGYEAKFNAHTDWDPGHTTHASSKNTLKAVGLWSHEVHMVTNQNVMYGSNLSPPRMEQIRNCVEDYYEDNGPGDPWFQLHLPHIAKQMCPFVDLKQPGAEQASIE